jgi:2-hydroxyacyl-CoA lyase 1
LLAELLYSYRIPSVYAVVGIPVVEVGEAIQRLSAVPPANHSINFYSFRNEQSASYAASAAGYLSSYPSVCLTVAGPGFIHSLSGLANAQVNNWPLIVVSGGISTQTSGKGAFQETPLLQLAQNYTKFAHRITDLASLPQIIEKSIRISLSGRPGPIFLEFPAELITSVIQRTSIIYPRNNCAISVPKPCTSQANLALLLDLLNNSSAPLLILGKGCAYGRAETSVRAFSALTGVPFLLMPMAKGLIDERNDQNVSGNRSEALKGADLVILLGARMNWMLHFGENARYNEDCKVVQVDISGEEIGNNVNQLVLPIQADIGEFCAQFCQFAQGKIINYQRYSGFLASLRPKIKQNQVNLNKLMLNDSNPMSYYRIYRDLAQIINFDPQFVVINEGANTMDIGRTCLLHSEPRLRLDAGTFATMGVGLGYAIAAHSHYNAPNNKQNKRIIAILGDSAFGFSAMEYETAVRYRMNIIFVIFNNSGIYYGSNEQQLQRAKQNPQNSPVTSLSYQSNYQCFALIFGGKGFLVTESQQLQGTLKEALEVREGPVIINIIMQSQAERKKQSHGWLTKAKL